MRVGDAKALMLVELPLLSPSPIRRASPMNAEIGPLLLACVPYTSSSSLGEFKWDVGS